VPTAKHDTTSHRSQHKRWNFKEFLSGFLIPRCVALRKELPPGARLLWAVIRAFSRRDGFCDAAETTMASRLGVSTRQIRRYLQKLEADGWVETELRTGSTARRYLLLHPLFGGAIAQPQDVNGQGSGRKRPGVRTDVSTTVKESRQPSGATRVETFSHLVGKEGRTNGMKSSAELIEQLSKNLDRTPSSNGNTPRQPLRRLADLTQDAAIRREVEAWNITCTEELLVKLMRKAAFYGVTGFQVAAAINAASRKVHKKPTAHPQGLGWFPTVVEDYFSQHFTPAHTQTAASRPRPKATHQ
jgi:Helix-turn-helix domain